MTQSITLATCLAGTPGGLSYLRASIKLRLRAWRHHEQTRDWMALLNSHGTLRELAATCPRLIHKIYRPYLSSRLNCQQRLGVLMTHYRFVLQHGLGAAVSQAARAPLVLARFAGKSEAPYTIELRAISAMEREGELVLQLRRADALVYSLAFSFLADGRQGALRSVGIGCVQGPQGEHGLELIREATRDLHGMRPKNLMVRLVRQLGFEYGCQRLILVGNDNRAVRQSVRKGLVLADYNALWLELGATERADGDYQLACEALLPPAMEEIPSKKRSEARKRHELLVAIIAATGAGLRAPAAMAAPAAPLLSLVPTLSKALPEPQLALDVEFDAAIA
ncbi:VirK/YbjX family protein [Rugamonas sp.]|uniref:VirK/YbjX family protein n=1 Tax=Rugamonas sp. TaxID=1926287 RepID=UPI0025F9879B|nr:VirK/YbjX family protein [Rugamonas sp.]